ncbi:hypothetical protein LTR37_012011 [Vermiconidia calcicola]|uniref:Uncharacterized protein n=1 Tax=Vermiconidia calcicola TaxID=1690605 RepID=A0ACC3N241_9PEZI|nr:hypothetical protein LTR37_012011 [Vermiconidia calcicola]
MADLEAAPVSYEDLAFIEDEFEEVDTEISSLLPHNLNVRKQYELSASLYAKRSAAASKIPNFWSLVFEQAPVEIDQYVQPHDSRIFAESLISFDVRRPELDTTGSGNPRSISVKFEFKPNDDFEDTVLEKTFWYRRSRDGWAGLVSEPVKIRWKKGKDLTEGLTDGAIALWEARKKIGDTTAKGLPEYTALKKKVESWNGMNTSFFTWFGWVSGRRWVSAEESEKANAEYAELKQKRKAGARVDVPDDEDDAEADIHDDDVEVHQAGEELAISFADDLWPNAIKLFTQAQEDDEEISEADFEDLDGEDMEDDEDGDGEPVDIRALVQDKGAKGRSRDSTGSTGPPSKKTKK